MREILTRVELFYLEDHVNYWLRFGDYCYEKSIDRRRTFVWFKQDQIFCYLRWWANDHGTQGWTLVVMRSGSPTEDNIQIYPGISPGAEILLRVRGVKNVKRVLEILENIERQGINLCDVSPNYYRHLGLCILMGKAPHLYGMTQHKAWQKTRLATWGVAK